MTLGTVQGVTDLTGNTETALIERQLVFARAIIDDELDDAGLTAPATSTTLSLAVNYLTAGLIGIKPGAVNPRTGFSVDGFSRKDGKDSQIDEWETRGMAQIAKYIKVTLTTCGIPDMAVVGRSGVRVGTYEEMANEDEY